MAEKKDASRDGRRSSTDLKPPHMDDIPKLLKAMVDSGEDEEGSVAATKKLYDLCDVGHKQNRVPMVCSGKYDVLTPLALCLMEGSAERRHIACLCLNNLSVPAENKRVMALGPASSEIIGGLCWVIGNDKPEAHLCCICLMNLSALESAIPPILTYNPVSREGVAPLPPLDNTNSLVRVLEKVLTDYSRLASGAVEGAKPSRNQAETVRWAAGLLKNLSKSEESAPLLGKTSVPICAVQFLRNQEAPPPSRWTNISIEESSLTIVLNLSQWDVSRGSLMAARAVEAIKHVMLSGGINALKATIACACLGARWSQFPDGGIPAARSVSELVSNTIDKKGSADDLYGPATFKLYTAIRAFQGLCKSARGADAGIGESHTKVLAAPSSVALCLRILSDHIIAATEAAEGGGAHGHGVVNSSSTASNAQIAECALKAIDAMLPAILQKGETTSDVEGDGAKTRRNFHDRYAAEIAQMLLVYADLPGTSEDGQRTAESVSEQIIASCDGYPRPTLELSHDLWTHHRRQAGQPLDHYLPDGANDSANNCAIQ